MGIKDYFADRALDRSLKNMPEGQRDLVKKIFKENPKLFEEISEEIKKRKKAGQNEMLASVSVMKKYEGKLRSLLQK